MTNRRLFIALNLSIWAHNPQWINNVCGKLGQRGFMACPWFAIGRLPVWRFKLVDGGNECSHPYQGEQTVREQRVPDWFGASPVLRRPITEFCKAYKFSVKWLEKLIDNVSFH